MKVFDEQHNQGWGYTFVPNGKYPVIGNRIFETYAGAESFLSHTTAIPGIILRVIEDSTASNNGAYLVEKDTTSTSGLKLTKIVTGIIDMSGKMIDVVWDEEKSGYYNETDDPEHTKPIIDPNVKKAGKYLMLTIGSDVTYILSTDLIDLSNYYTKTEIDAKFQSITDEQIKSLFDDTYVKTTAAVE